MAGVIVNMQISHVELCRIVSAVNARLLQYLGTVLAADVVRRAQSGDLLLTVSEAEKRSVEAVCSDWEELMPKGTVAHPGYEQAFIGKAEFTKAGTEFRGMIAAEIGIERFTIAQWHEGERLYGGNPEKPLPYTLCGVVGPDIAKALGLKS